jgi:hypothetical protein
MKTLRFSLLVAMICVAGSAFGQEPKAKAEDKASEAVGMSDFFVMVPHTQEQCLQSLDQMKAKGDELLSKFEYGCVSGDHTAYGFIKGSSEESVKKMLPASEQPKAKITKVKKLSVADIEKLHKDHAM